MDDEHINDEHFTCDRTMNGEVIRPLLNKDKARRRAILIVLDFFKKNGIEYKKGIGGDVYHLKNPLSQIQSEGIRNRIEHLEYRLVEKLGGMYELI
jgi:hypothetical protein